MKLEVVTKTEYRGFSRDKLVILLTLANAGDDLATWMAAQLLTGGDFQRAAELELACKELIDDLAAAETLN